MYQFAKNPCIYYVILLLNNLFLTAIAICERPNHLVAAEDVCWSSKVEVVERIQYTSKSVLNFAKKKLGMDVEDEAKPQKCTYYQCILQELKVASIVHYYFNKDICDKYLDARNFPDYDRLQKWTENNVIYHHAVNLLRQEEMCNYALGNSTLSGTYFSAENLDYPGIETEVQSLQNECEIAAEFTKCLSLADKSCIIFQFP